MWVHVHVRFMCWIWSEDLLSAFILRVFLFLCHLVLKHLGHLSDRAPCSLDCGVACLCGALSHVLPPVLSSKRWWWVLALCQRCQCHLSLRQNACPHPPSVMFIHNMWHHHDHQQSDVYNQFKIFGVCAFCHFIPLEMCQVGRPARLILLFSQVTGPGLVSALYSQNAEWVLPYRWL